MKFAWISMMAGVVWLGVLAPAVFAGEEDSAAMFKKLHELPMPGEVLMVEGRPAFIILPEMENRKSPLPWVWYAPTLPGLPGAEEKWMFRQFLYAGIAVCGIDVGESYGNPEGRRTLHGPASGIGEEPRHGLEALPL